MRKPRLVSVFALLILAAAGFWVWAGLFGVRAFRFLDGVPRSSHTIFLPRVWGPDGLEDSVYPVQGDMEVMEKSAEGELIPAGFKRRPKPFPQDYWHLDDLGIRFASLKPHLTEISVSQTLPDNHWNRVRFFLYSKFGSKMKGTTVIDSIRL